MHTNLFIITSCLELRNSAIPYELRFPQTCDTIDSVKKCYPDAYIVIVDGLDTTEENKTALKDRGAHVFMYFNGRAFKKSMGEMFLLTNFFHSAEYQRIITTFPIKRIHKLSGRYELLEAKPDIPLDKFIFKYFIGYHNVYMYITSYYAIPSVHANIFIERLTQLFLKFIHNGPDMHDVEHWFYMYQVLPKDLGVNCEYLGVKGILGGDGTLAIN